MSSTECSTTIADKKYYSSENDPITPDELERLYVDRGLSRRKIATMHLLQPSKVKHLLRKYGILRPGEVEWSREELERLYFGEARTIEKLTDELGSYRNKVIRHLRYYGITKSKSQTAKERNKTSSTAAHYYTSPAGYEVWHSHTDSTTFGVHRLVAVAEFGFDKVVGNHVHHLNGVPWDNRPENLDVVGADRHGSIHLDPIVHWLERAPDEIVAMAMRRSGYEDVAEEIP